MAEITEREIGDHVESFALSETPCSSEVNSEEGISVGAGNTAGWEGLGRLSMGKVIILLIAAALMLLTPALRTAHAEDGQARGHGGGELL